MSLNAISRTKIALFYALWWISLIVLETYALMHTFGFGWNVALVDTVDTNLLIATAGYSMYSGLHYYQPSPKNAIYLVIWSVMLAVLCVGVHNVLMAKFFVNDVAYHEFLPASHLMRGLFCWFMIILMVILSYTWYYWKDQQASLKRDHDAAKLAREAELSTLRQQLQPHFLFNSLNSISALAGSNPEEARRMIQQLSDFLRGTIRRDDQHLVPLEDELKHLQLYLEIEKVRFGHRLRTEITTDPDSRLVLPSLLLQPIVENAIKFGLYDTTGEITIRIAAYANGRELIIRVENPYDPTTAAPRQGTGFGLNSIQRRLYLLFARQDLLTTQQSENIFVTTVKIPQPA
ncbi:MAG TPA: histidine kinase [Ohtaekwangia sp.]|nr:histidine kinase [Ohtaekwangia sp.]